MCALITALASACGTPTSTAPAESDQTITATDNRGVTITLDGPVERAVVVNGYANEFVQAIDAQDQVVGVDQSSVERLPYVQFDTDSIVGQDYSQLNYEKIVDLDPDLVILPSIAPYEEAERQLAEFNIPVAVITGFEIDRFNENFDFLGTVFGKQERADEVKAFRSEIETLVADRLPETQPLRVYYEEPTSFVTFGPTGAYDTLINESGNINIAADLPASEEEQTIDPAVVLTADPQLIFKEMDTNYEPYPSSVQTDTLDEMLARPGWADLTAAKNGSVYVVNGFLTSALGKTMGLLYLASWSHPEAFAGVDPDDYLQRWITDFQRAEFLGTDAYLVKADPR
ncbi:ABC transporter substrate-binding protein [Mycolicibacterium palauense]|uniref:ABC transporter substrate-binding protein n=1 Tax=Mycolicibacterium palauense TaxID=2034511 RepID=UPI00159B8614|nr:ABC transporter substrate-binding protein [Mycolicibacterium palauense]